MCWWGVCIICYVPKQHLLGRAQKIWIVQHTILRFCWFLLVVSFVIFCKVHGVFLLCTYNLARFQFVLDLLRAWFVKPVWMGEKRNRFLGMCLWWRAQSLFKNKWALIRFYSAVRGPAGLINWVFASKRSNPSFGGTYSHLLSRGQLNSSRL